MTKLDLKKDLKQLYQSSPKKAAIVEVPELKFLMIDGSGDPNNSQEFQDAVEALYGISYTVKFDLKKKGIGPEYVVMPLEGLWWMEGNREFDMDDKDSWLWTLMILQPNHINAKMINEGTEQLKKKKNPPLLHKVRFENFSEGLSAQILHIGPYADEKPTIEKLHSFVNDNNYKLRGKHHEIYLSDPRRTKPERLKTIIRHPVTPAE